MSYEIGTVLVNGGSTTFEIIGSSDFYGEDADEIYPVKVADETGLSTVTVYSQAEIDRLGYKPRSARGAGYYISPHDLRAYPPAWHYEDDPGAEYKKVEVTF